MTKRLDGLNPDCYLAFHPRMTGAWGQLDRCLVTSIEVAFLEAKCCMGLDQYSIPLS